MSVRKHTPKQHGSILILNPLPSRSKFRVHLARPNGIRSLPGEQLFAAPASVVHHGCSLFLDLIYYNYYVYSTCSILSRVICVVAVILNLEACWLDDFPLTFHGLRSRCQFEIPG